MKTWNLYLDDVRDCPFVDGNWLVARSSQEALDLYLVEGMPAFMSLDHDLGGEDTTMQFLRMLEAHSSEDDRIPEYVVHSSNPVGKMNIVSFMESWKKSRLMP